MKNILRGRTGQWIRRCILFLLDMVFVYLALQAAIALRYEGRISLGIFRRLMEIFPQMLGVYAICAIAGGANMTYGSNGHTTRTMVREFVNSGDYVKLTGSEYLSSSKLLKRGDILVKEGSHTAMVLDNGADVAVEAPVEPPVVNLPLEDDATVYYSVRMPLLQKGMTRDAVRAMQFLLDAHGFDVPLFGTFNARTESALMEFQRDFNLQVDGKCGPETWSALLGLTGVG
jgi:hypothetical protein